MSAFETLVPALGWALLHFLWQGLLVGLLATLLLSLLRNARPQARYLVACLALLLCLLLPLAGTWRGMQGDGSDLHDRIAVQGTAMPVGERMVDTASGIEPLRRQLHAQLPAIVVLWSLGAALFTLRLLLGLAWVENLRARGRTDEEWQRRLQRLANRLGLNRPVRLLFCDALESPVALGILRPAVILPAALVARLPTDLIEALLAHELAHVRRHDYLINLLQGLVEALLFYHPVVWWLSRRIRSEREQVADDLAANALGEPRRLALALSELDCFQSALVPATAANGGNLMNRIQRLVRPRPQVLGWKALLPVLGLTLACLAVSAHSPEPADAAGAAAKAEAAASVQARASEQARESRKASAGNDDHEGYAFVEAHRDGITMSGDIADIPEIKRARAAVQGDFLWFRRDGKSYVLQDEELMRQAREAWKPMRALEEKMAALEAEMQPHESAVEKLDEEMEALSRRGEPRSEALEALGRRMEAMGERHEALLAKLEAALEHREKGDTGAERERRERALAALEAQRGQLQQEMDALGRKMEAEQAELEASLAPLEALGRRMEQASEPMEAIGRRMEAIGQEQEKLSELADQEVQRLIERALREGRARRMDGNR